MTGVQTCALPILAAYLTTNGYVNTNSAYANSNVASYLITNGYVNTNSAYANANVASYLPTYTGNIGAGNIIGTTPNVTITAGTYTTTFDTTGNISAPAGFFATGNIQSAGYLFGNGSQLTGLPATYSNVQTAAYLNATGYNLYSNVNVAAYLNTQGYNLYSNVNVAVYLATATINTTGNITAAYLNGNINLTGNIQGTTANVQLVAGSYTSTFDNQGNVALGNAALPVRIYATGNISTAGNITASYYFGNGSQLTGISVSSDTIFNGTSNVTIGTSGGNANVSIGGTANVAVFATTGVVVKGNIENGGSNGVGNIGSSSTYFNTVFAKSTSAQYADLAERFAADEYLEAGTVVELGGAAEITIAKIGRAHV